MSEWRANRWWADSPLWFKAVVVWFAVSSFIRIPLTVEIVAGWFS